MSESSINNVEVFINDDLLPGPYIEYKNTYLTHPLSSMSIELIIKVSSNYNSLKLIKNILENTNPHYTVKTVYTQEIVGYQRIPVSVEITQDELVLCSLETDYKNLISTIEFVKR